MGPRIAVLYVTHYACGSANNQGPTGRIEFYSITTLFGVCLTSYRVDKRIKPEHCAPRYREESVKSIFYTLTVSVYILQPSCKFYNTCYARSRLSHPRDK